MTWCNDLERHIVATIKVRGPLSGPEIGGILHVAERRVRAIIKHLRIEHHIPICATPNEGFYYPRKRSDADHTLANLHSLRGEIDQTIGGIEEGLDREFGHPCLFEWEDTA